MRITITSKLVSAQINEGSSFTATASFFDDSSDVWSASTPSTTRYRIDRINGDPACWQTILDWTTLTPATTNNIVVTGSQNAIQSTWSYNEKRQITVEANAGLSTQYQETYLYSIKNLAGQS